MAKKSQPTPQFTFQYGLAVFEKRRGKYEKIKEIKCKDEVEMYGLLYMLESKLISVDSLS